MSDTLFELACNQTITPTIGTYTGADNNTPVYELVDSDYYLKNISSHGYYYFNVTSTASRMLVSFDCVFNNKSNFNWILLFENTQGKNWWGIGSYYSGLELRGTSTSAQTLKTNIVGGTKLHIDIQIEHSTLANVVTILIDNTEVLNINLPSTYELSNFELLGNTGNYTSNCYIKDLSIGTYGKDYLNKSGLAEIWANIKNYITAQLLGKSNVGHTHVKNDITDFPTIPTKTSDLTNDSGFLTSHQDLSGYVPRSGGAVFTGQEFSRNVNDSTLVFRGGINAWGNGAQLELCGKDYNNAGSWGLASHNGSDYSTFSMSPNGTIYATHGAGQNVAYATPYNWVEVDFFGGDSRDNGSSLQLHGKDFAFNNYLFAGAFTLQARTTFDYQLVGFANGSLTWNGQAIQTVSDQRLKQQIAEIDDKLLDAWEDVELCQFKYNDAVDQKGDNARLHTGYVVQQINKACKEHGVDVSAYGLYCHEEYPQETQEVEIEQADGTKTKETRVIREASEHYSLRYTEVYAVECMYLRRCIARLTARIEELEKGNNTK